MSPLLPSQSPGFHLESYVTVETLPTPAAWLHRGTLGLGQATQHIPSSIKEIARHGWYHAVSVRIN